MQNYNFILEVVNLTNQYRIDNELSPLSIDLDLQQAAQLHSQNMANQDFFSHIGLDGSSPGDRAVSAGYESNFVGENIAAGNNTPQSVVNGWINSPGHRNNILNPNYNEIGVGYYFLENDTGNVNYNYYWTQKFGKGEIETPQETIGEYGTLTNLDHNWQTIILNQNYINPVVIVSDPTLNGTDPATVRLQNVTGNSFDLRIQEANYKDDIHTTETVSYLVVEAGDWELSDGTRISAGTQNSNLLSSQGFETVALSEFDQTPTLLTQVQTYNGPDWVTTRTKNMTANSFDLTMQEEEALNGGGHATETIGWLAIDQGMGNDGDTLLQGGLTESTHKHIPETVNFEQSFNEIPIVFAKLGSYFGSDPANIRLGSISNSGFEARVYEDQSFDTEINHVNEQIAFLALGDSSGLFTGSLI